MPRRSRADTTGDGQRFLIACGVGRYDHLPPGDQLQEAAEDVRRIVDAFTRLAYVRVLEEIGDSPRHDDLAAAIDRWLHAPQRRSTDIVTIYFSGHGFTTLSREHYLLGRNYEHDLLSTALPTADFARWLASSPVRQLLLLLDTCEAGQGVFDFSTFTMGVQAARARGEGALEVYGIGAALPRQEAAQGLFSRALVAALGNRRVGGETQPFLFPQSIVEAINDELPEGQTAILSMPAATGVPRFLPNPRYRAGTPAGIDLELQAHLRTTRTHDLAAHWSPRARGVEVEPQAGWYFTGRTAALRELVAFLRSEEPSTSLRVVTGSPGAGKSAVLGRLVTLSDAEYRKNVPTSALPREEDVLPPEGSIKLAVHAKGKTLTDVINEFAGGVFRVVSPGKTLPWTPGFLLNALGTDRRTFTFVLDALDEAAEPELIAYELLRPMGVLPNLKVIVGTREQFIRYLGPGAVEIDLDDPRYVERADLAGYVEKRLLAVEEPQVRTPYRGRPELARAVAAAVARQAFPIFLIARIVSHSLIAADRPVDVSVQGWEEHFPESVGAAFDDYLRRFGDREPLVRDLFRALAWSEGSGLPWENLWAPLASILSGRKYSDADVEWLLQHGAPYIVEDLEEGRSVYRLYHQALTDHLRGSREQAPFVHQKIASALVAAVPKTRAGRDWLAAPPYVRRHFAAHAAAAGELAEHLDDASFLLAADPVRLQRAVAVSGASDALAAYLSVIPYISTEALGAGAAYLAMRAKQLRNEPLARRAAALPLRQPWSTRWCLWEQEFPHRMLLADHPVTALAVERSGSDTIIAAGLEDGSILVWSVTGERITVPLRGHDDAVGVIAIFPSDPPVIVSAGNTGEICIWTVLGATASRRVVKAHKGMVAALTAAVIDGQPAVVSAGIDQEIRFFALADGSELLPSLRAHVRGNEFVQALAFVSGGGLFCGSRDGTLWHVALDPAPAVATKIGSIGRDRITALAAAFDNKRLVVVTGSEEGSVSAWRQDEGWRRWKLGKHHQAVTGITLVPWADENGRLQMVAVSGSEDEAFAVWSLAGAELARVHAHEGSSVSGIGSVWSGKKELTVVSSGDHTVRVWPVTRGMRSATGGVRSVVALCRFGRNRWLAVSEHDGGRNVINIREARSAEVTATLAGHRLLTMTLAFAAEPGLPPILISGGEDQSVRFWALNSGRRWRRGGGRVEGGVMALAVAHHDGRAIVVSASDEGILQRWSLATGDRIGAPIRGHKDSVMALAVVPRELDDVIVSGSDDGTIRFWSAATGRPLGRVVHGKDRWVSALAYGRIGGRDVLVSGDEETLRAWDPHIRTPLDVPFGKHEQSVAALAFVRAGNEQWLLAGGADRQLRVYASLGSQPRVIDLFAPIASIAADAVNEVFVGTTLGVVALDLSKLFEE